MATKKKKSKKLKCEAQTDFCSGEGVNPRSVNGSGKEGKMFNICLACCAILRRSGHKIN